MLMPHRGRAPGSGPVTMLVSYYPKPGKEIELRKLVEKHWPALDRLGLVTDMKPRIWQATDIRSSQRYFVELFQWKDGSSSDVAHQSPEVMAIWEPMGPVLEKLQLTELEPLASGLPD
jgi:hypothetical protein